MGTPEFACPSLEALAGERGVEVSLVVTQPDRPAGRGRRLQAPPVKQTAERLGLPIYQAASLRSAEQRQPIVDANPDLIVVVAFGLVLGKSILELPRCGCVNLHASLLPKYRGASPIPAAILSGDLETGVTLMRMERGLDTGPVLARSALDITPVDTTASLTNCLANIAAELLMANLGDLVSGKLTAVPQPIGSSLTRPLVKADGWIDWTLPVAAVERHVRAMWSWPRAWTTLPDGSSFQVHRVYIADLNDSALPGVIVADRTGFHIRCADGWLEVATGQLAGGKALGGAQLASNRVFANEPILGQSARPTVPGPLIQAVE